MLKMITNKIISNPDFAAIDNSFEIYKVSTLEKYISGGASYLDNLAEGSILSVVFEKGNAFYILSKKGQISKSDLIKILRTYDSGDKLSIDTISSKLVPENNLLQLFFNAIGYDETGYFSFNNLTGKLFCYNKNWQNIDKKTGKVWGLQCLEIKIAKDMTIHFMAHKMSSILFRKEMVFQKRKFQDYPQYKIAFVNNTLKRVTKEELNNEENFIIKPVANEKGFIDFFDFSDDSKFETSKLGCFYNLFTVFEKKYGGFFNIQFEQIEISQSLQLSRKELSQYKKVVENIILEKGLNFVDCTGFETAKEHLEDIANEIVRLFPGTKCSVQDTLSKSKLNIRYIKDKSCYEEKEDPHQDKLDGYIVQHITNNYSYDSKAATTNILKELVIKNDIKEGKISLFDWASLGYDSDWIFGLKSEQKFVFMKIHPDGSFLFEEMEADLFNQSEYDEYMDLLDSEDTLGLVKDNFENINIIMNTNLFTLPDFKSIGDILKEINRNDILSGNTLKEIIPDFSNRFEDKDYTKKEILELFENRSDKKVVVEKIFQDTGIRLYSYLRGKEQREQYFSGIIDVNFISVNDREAYYNVGEVGNGMKNSFERASVIRKIEAPEGNKLILNELLPLMGVEFVRYGMLTVTPFPFKYLREFTNYTKSVNK